MDSTKHAVPEQSYRSWRGIAHHVRVWCPLSLLCIADVALAGVIRVPSDQLTIQGGIDAAASGDTVLVAAGVHAGIGNNNLSVRNKDIEVRSESGPEATVIDCEGSGRGFSLIGLTSAGIIEGFTIRNGDLSGGDPTGGGGMMIFRGAPRIFNCNFERNHAEGQVGFGGGGAIAVYEASPTIADCRFVENDVSGSGAVGGAIAVLYSRIQVTNCSFERNVVTPMSGGGGGGIGMVPTTIDTVQYIAIIENCDFSDNEANLGGGGSFIRAQLMNCRFNGNQALHGGGINASVSDLTDCSVVGNRASGFGGGASVRACTMTRCLITDNEAPEGGGVRDTGLITILSNCIIARNSASRGGGYAGVERGSEFKDCTISDNEAPVGSGVFLLAAEDEVWLFERTIIAGGRVGEAIRCDGNASALLSCADVFGNAGGDWIGCIMGQKGLEGNLSADPLFCQADIDWHLCSDSPCAPEQTGACGLIGAFPVGCEACGPQALEPSTWGQIKYQARRLAPASSAGK